MCVPRPEASLGLEGRRIVSPVVNTPAGVRAVPDGSHRSTVSLPQYVVRVYDQSALCTVRPRVYHQRSVSKEPARDIRGCVRACVKTVTGEIHCSLSPAAREVVLVPSSLPHDIARHRVDTKVHVVSCSLARSFHSISHLLPWSWVSFTERKGEEGRERGGSSTSLPTSCPS